MNKFAYEIPFNKEKKFQYRFFEILPGTLSWSILALPFVLAFLNVSLAAMLMIAYLLLWFVKAATLNVRVIQGYRTLSEHQRLDWGAMIKDLDQTDVEHKHFPSWHHKNKKRQADNPNGIYSKNVVHAVIIATYNEAYEVLKPTLDEVANSLYDKKKLIVMLAYEERGGKEVAAQAKKLMAEYKDVFLVSEAYEHPADIEGEVVGKGGNITHTGRELEKVVEKLGINPRDVLVTTLDADNRPHKSYFAGLTYVYCNVHDPKYMSFQPIPMFTNNIWDAPAPMRVIATGNSYWNMIQGRRQHMLRNFSSHAQPLDALIETDFWSVRTIVEDGHQFWRSYFAFDGQHEVIPIFLPIYQDAVLADGYRRTLKAQFYQLRRWAYGASDVAYVAKYAFYTKNKISLYDRITKFARLLEGHISWATSPLILAFGALLPWLFNRTSFTANQLPQISSRIQTLAMAGILVTLFLSFKILPKKPARYKRSRSIFMIAQWVLLPFTTIVYSSFAAINSQTRLIFKRYLEKFDVTEKAIKTADGTVTSFDE